MDTGQHCVSATSAQETQTCWIVLERGCTCKGQPKHVCLYHRCVDMATNLDTKVHNTTARQLANALGLRPPALDFPEAALMALTAFRAGHATGLGRRGNSLREILLSGEWKPAAYFAYCNPDEVDAAAFLTVQIENSNTGNSCATTWHR